MFFLYDVNIMWGSPYIFQQICCLLESLIWWKILDIPLFDLGQNRPERVLKLSRCSSKFYLNIDFDFLLSLKKNCFSGPNGLKSNIHPPLPPKKNNKQTNPVRRLHSFLSRSWGYIKFTYLNLIWIQWNLLVVYLLVGMFDYFSSITCSVLDESCQLFFGFINLTFNHFPEQCKKVMVLKHISTKTFRANTWSRPQIQELA